MLKSKLFAVIATVPLALALSAQTAPAQLDFYTVALVISDSGQVIGSPRLKTAAGETATFHIKPGDGTSYKAQMTPSAAGNGTVTMTSRVDVTSPSVGTIQWNSKFEIDQTKPVRIEYGNKSPGERPLRIEVALIES